VERGIDVWFSRYEDKLLYATSHSGEPPMWRGGTSKGPAGTLKRLKEKGFTIVTVGICDPMMMGVL